MDLVLRRENVYEGFQKQWMIRYALSHDSPGKQMRDAMRVTSDDFQKFAVYAVLELCARCRYQHMRIELLFHMVSLICCLEVRLVQ